MLLRVLLRISQNVNKRIFVGASGSAAALLHTSALTDRRRHVGGRWRCEAHVHCNGNGTGWYREERRMDGVLAIDAV